MSLGFTGYSSLNGLGLITGTTSGYGGYGYYGGLSDSTYVENAKTSITNGYSLRAAQQSVTTLQSAEKTSHNLDYQTIKDLLQDGRTDDALTAFNDLADEMSELEQYQSYDKKYIKSLMHTEYAAACNSTLLGDIAKYSDSSFISGIKNSNPLSIFLCQSNSKADMKGEVTGKGASNGDTFIKCTGAAVGGIGTVAALSGLKAVSSSWKTAKTAAGSSGKFFNTLGKAGGVLMDKVKNLKGSSVKWVAIGGAVLGLACVAGKWLLNKATDNSASA